MVGNWQINVPVFLHNYVSATIARQQKSLKERRKQEKEAALTRQNELDTLQQVCRGMLLLQFCPHITEGVIHHFLEQHKLLRRRN